MRVSDIPEIARLSTPEKILLVEDLWDSIASDEAGVPVPQSHMEELDRRLKSYESDPGEFLSFEELQVRIERMALSDNTAEPQHCACHLILTHNCLLAYAPSHEKGILIR